MCFELSKNQIMEHRCIVKMIDIHDFDPFNAWTTASLLLRQFFDYSHLPYIEDLRSTSSIHNLLSFCTICKEHLNHNNIYNTKPYIRQCPIPFLFVFS